MRTVNWNCSSLCSVVGSTPASPSCREVQEEKKELKTRKWSSVKKRSKISRHPNSKKGRRKTSFASSNLSSQHCHSPNAETSVCEKILLPRGMILQSRCSKNLPKVFPVPSPISIIIFSADFENLFFSEVLCIFC